MRQGNVSPRTPCLLLHVIANHCVATQMPVQFLHVIANRVLAHAEAPLPSACHCEPVRTLVWQSASPQKCLASWQLFGQIRYALRICPKYCFPLCATARRTDCHVASLLAMTRGRHVIASNVLAPAHTSFLQHVIAPVLAHAEAPQPSACHCEPVRTLVWQSVFPAGKLGNLVLLRANS